MAKISDTAAIRVSDMSEEGNGIGHIDGKAVFVKDTAVGDLAEVMIIKDKKSYAYGRLLHLLEPSVFRVTPRCPVARACGGCTLQHMDYQEQLRLKEKRVADCLTRIGGIEDAREKMEPILGMMEPFHFRNKMQFPVGLGKDGEVKLGFYVGRTHSIVDTADCPAGHPVNRLILAAVRKWIEKEQKKTGHFVYDEKKHTGILRHVMARVGYATGEIMVVPVVKGKGFSPDQKENERLKKTLLEELLGAVETYNREEGGSGDPAESLGGDWKKKLILSSVVLNLNPEKTNRILGEKCITLYGEDSITDYIGKNRFKISPLSFFQVNPLQTERLYGKALEFAGLSGQETVWDMYCGAGTISLSLAQKAKQVFGVEIVPQAVENARENARLNSVENAEFFAGSAEAVVPALYTKDATRYQADVVVVDPPRKGCDAVLLNTIGEMAPERIVYVSCDPATLARDIRILSEKGYRLVKAAPVDMFPQSMHVETVVLMSRVKD